MNLHGGVASNNVTILEVGKAEKDVLANLTQLYRYDSSEVNGDDIDSLGKFDMGKHFDAYWLEPERYPFFIKYGDKLVGFALVRQIEAGKYSVAEFFVARKYRHMGIGKRAATLLFDTFRAEWHVAQKDGNVAAQKFWKAVVRDYTGGDFVETFSTGQPRGPKQVFRSRDA